MADEHHDILPTAVRRRRDALHAVGLDTRGLAPADTLGIAFSGGGIRSATISLGIAQALARYDRLLAFDYMSTVSGGGYFGSFLRSLFVPNEARGPAGVVTVTDPARFRFADEVLRSEPSQREVDAPGSAGSAKVANPIWWLREHSRYLAPSGPTDFAFAISHMARNWMAMIYVFFIATVFLFATKTLLIAAPVELLGWLGWCGNCGRDLLVHGDLKFSPFLIPAAILVFASLTVGAAFWLTEAIFANGPWRWNARTRENLDPSKWQRAFIATCLKTLGGLGAVVALRLFYDAPLSPRAGWFLGMGFLFALTMILWAVVCYIVLLIRTWLKYGKKDLPTRKNWREKTPAAEMGRLLTRWLSVTNIALLVCLALFAVDTAGIMLDHLKMVPVSLDDFGNLMTAAILPAAAFLISKFPTSFPGKRKLPPQVISGLTVATGASLFAATAVIAAGLVHRLAWYDGVFGRLGFDWPTFIVFYAIVVLLFLMTGSSGGFINLSSLHGFYASRLTRAYIGATNTDRLKPGGGLQGTLAARPLKPGENKPDPPRINRNVINDYIDASLYQTLPLPAPIHLINVTLNDSEGGSSLVDRARKGALMTFAPEGVFVGSKKREWPSSASWRRLTRSAETLTVGQLCAISGAAASSGMGRMTTLGGALTLTFANVRTGYWWRKGQAFPIWGSTRWKNPVWALFDTYSYLLNEMTARYSRSFRRLYLSDGGHYENSGTLELIRRGCRLIIAADNGCDHKMEFGDLEIVIRTARLDLGRNVEVASDAEVAAFAGYGSTAFFFNGGKRDWRECVADKDGEAFALLLNVTRSEGLKQVHCGHIVWLKPHIIEGLSADVAGYAAAHPSFPHESTGDQFFDEAQWESYRRMGVEMAIRLLGDPSGVRRHIPELKARQV